MYVLAYPEERSWLMSVSLLSRKYSLHFNQLRLRPHDRTLLLIEQRSAKVFMVLCWCPNDSWAVWAWCWRQQEWLMYEKMDHYIHRFSHPKGMGVDDITLSSSVLTHKTSKPWTCLNVGNNRNDSSLTLMKKVTSYIRQRLL